MIRMISGRAIKMQEDVHLDDAKAFNKDSDKDIIYYEAPLCDIQSKIST